MSGELILVVHPQDGVLDRISESLHGAGYKVMSAGAAQEAVERFGGSRFARPDAVLTPVDTEHPEGSPLLERLRDGATRRRLPVVVLADGDPEARRHALRLGLTHVVAAPFDDEEVVLSTRLALEQHRDDRLLSGSLAQMSPVELLQSAEVNRRGGTVVLKHRGRVGTVWLRDGQVIDAEIDDGRRREEAVYGMAAWDEGTFEANFGPVSVPRRITAGTTALLLESMRRLDEAGRGGEVDDEQPPNAAMPDPPPPPPRRLLTLHRAVTLLNLAASYAAEHAEPRMVAERLETMRRRLARDHGVLTAFAVTGSAQVSVDGDAPGLSAAPPERLVAATAGWLKELFGELERALPGRFPLERLRGISAAVHGDLDELGFYRELGVQPPVDGDTAPHSGAPAADDAETAAPEAHPAGALGAGAVPTTDDQVPTEEMTS